MRKGVSRSRAAREVVIMMAYGTVEEPWG